MIEYSGYIDSPLGILKIGGDADTLREILFDREGHSPTPVPSCLQQCAEQLAEYFQGKRTYFDLQLRPEGSEFQKRVWKELMQIPYGKTISYHQLAKALGHEGATRAVGAANGRNPISIIIPCHRVIGSDGNLTGYGGGMANKRYLLQLEGSLPQLDLFA